MEIQVLADAILPFLVQIRFQMKMCIFLIGVGYNISQVSTVGLFLSNLPSEALTASNGCLQDVQPITYRLCNNSELAR